jgi:predicted transcriptional regulator
MDRDTKSSPPALGPLEFEVMDVLWARGECGVRDVIPCLGRTRAYSTVMSALDRLFRKAFVERRTVGQVFLYSPRLSREEWTSQMVGHLMAVSLESRLPATEAASFLVEAISQKDESLLDQLLAKIEAKRRDLDGKKES